MPENNRQHEPDQPDALPEHPPGPAPALAGSSPDAPERTAAGDVIVDAYRELFERSADAILIIDGETFVDCNQATVEMLRYRNREELLKTHPSELSPPKQPDGRDSYEKANEMIARALERGSHRFEWDHRRADGEVFPVEVLLTAVQQADRKILHTVWRDITDRKRLESELRHAQKMEAIGKLAGGVAHDFNNLLVAIVGNADLLRITLDGDSEATAYVDQIQLASDRAAGLVQQLLAFSRKQESVLQVLDVNVLIGRIQALLERLIGEDIRLETKLERAPLRILGDSGQVEQVVLNLVSNARDAMPDGGVLSITTRLVEAEGQAVGETKPLAPGSHVLVSVSDTGVGMSREVQDRAFDPFFTTKEMGKGTGLGLATVYGFVQQAKGQVFLHSTVDQGTTVNVYFPLSDAEFSDLHLEEAAPSEEGGNEMILLVEDEEAVSSFLVEALTRQGYQVLQASNGREAGEIYRHFSREIDLIVTDVIMPEIGGPQLIATLHEAGHSPRVLFLSGYTDSELARLKGIGYEVDLLRKPFHARDLTRRVRLALDRP